MRARQGTHAAIAGALALFPELSFGHAFSTPYVLPIPYWMYVYGCAATLIVTFAVLGIFVSGPRAAAPAGPVKSIELQDRSIGHWIFLLLRVGALVALVVTIVLGLIGGEGPSAAVPLILFWVVFLLAWAYLTVLFGDLYPFVNPWMTLVQALDRIGVPLSAVPLRYPSWLGYWPAFVGYLVLIWVELFIEQTPQALARMLLLYTAVTLLGVGLFGKRDWFERADVFTVFFSIFGKMAPVLYVRGDDERIREIQLRRPFSGLLNERPQHLSLLLFVLFMLASTAYDGIYDTQLWTALFWRNMLSLLQPLWGDDLGQAQLVLMDLFLVYRQAGLFVFPFLYLIVFLTTIMVARWLTGAASSSRELTLRFTYTLVPIAFVYHVAHYYTLLIIYIRELPSSFASLFTGAAAGVSLNGSEGAPTDALEMGVVWHTQVALVLLGHVISVVLAHGESLRVFSRRRTAIVSQLPLLFVMVTYTVLGLWILTLPLS